MLTNLNKIEEKEEKNFISNNSFDLDGIDEDKALMGFITDYLIKRGLMETVSCLYSESDSMIPKENLPKLINSVNEVRGQSQTQNENDCVLFEWWRVFWNILKENNNNKDNKEKSGKEDTLSINEDVKFNIKRPISQQIIPIPSNPNMSSSMNLYKKTKKKPIKCVDTLDISSLTGIERSLTATGLMNKDLNKLTAEESEKIGLALKWNKVSKESWELYLKLCKEYQKTRGNSTSNPNVKQSKPNLSTVSSSNFPKTAYQNPLPALKAPTSSNYLGVIDQMAQPIDSRQLLLLRQSLFHEYLKKQQQNAEIMIPTHMNYNINCNSNNSNNNSSSVNLDNNLPSVLTSPPDFNENFFEKDAELNFNDFMNEYLI